jgi:hypothetical protein
MENRTGFEPVWVVRETTGLPRSRTIHCWHTVPDSNWSHGLERPQGLTRNPTVHRIGGWLIESNSKPFRAPPVFKTVPSPARITILRNWHRRMGSNHRGQRSERRWDASNPHLYRKRGRFHPACRGLEPRETPVKALGTSWRPINGIEPCSRALWRRLVSQRLGRIRGPTRASTPRRARFWRRTWSQEGWRGRAGGRWVRALQNAKGP